MFSQNDLIHQLHAKIDLFIQILDNTITAKESIPSENHRNIIPPYMANQILRRYRITKDILRQECDDIIELRKRILDNEDPQIKNIDNKIHELQKKLKEAIELLEAQKKSIELMEKVHTNRRNKSSEKAAGKQILEKIERFFLTNYGVTVTKCDIFEDCILTLAGIEEKPTSCSFDYQTSLSPSKLKKNHTMANSIFFSLGLSDSSIQKLMEYANENTLEPFDYSDKIPKKTRMHLIRMNSERIITIVLPKIKAYLDEHLNEVIRYHQIINNPNKGKQVSFFFAPPTSSVFKDTAEKSQQNRM